MPRKPDASALVVVVPEAEAVVGRWRHDLDPSARQGVPAHITLLYPFMPPAGLDPAVREALATLFAATPGWHFSLGQVVYQDGLLHLPPRPAAPFIALTHALVARWPAFPHYRGKYGPDVMPHLSIGYGDGAPDAEARAAIIADVQPRLPLACAAVEVALMLRQNGRWSLSAHLPLGALPLGALPG